MGDLGGHDGPKALQEATQKRTATRAKCYAHSGFGDKGAGSKRKSCYMLNIASRREKLSQICARETLRIM